MSFEEIYQQFEVKRSEAYSLTVHDQQDFIIDTFKDINSLFEKREINHEQYVKLAHRLALYANRGYNDLIDALMGAALAGLLDVVIQSRTADLAAIARANSGDITAMTGILPIELEEDYEE